MCKPFPKNNMWKWKFIKSFFKKKISFKEGYLRFCQTSLMSSLPKKVNCLAMKYLRKKHFIIDVCQKKRSIIDVRTLNMFLIQAWLSEKLMALRIKFWNSVIKLFNFFMVRYDVVFSFFTWKSTCELSSCRLFKYYQDYSIDFIEMFLYVFDVLCSQRYVVATVSR